MARYAALGDHRQCKQHKHRSAWWLRDSLGQLTDEKGTVMTLNFVLKHNWCLCLCVCRCVLTCIFLWLQNFVDSHVVFATSVEYFHTGIDKGDGWSCILQSSARPLWASSKIINPDFGYCFQMPHGHNSAYFECFLKFMLSNLVHLKQWVAQKQLVLTLMSIFRSRNIAGRGEKLVFDIMKIMEIQSAEANS